MVCVKRWKSDSKPEVNLPAVYVPTFLANQREDTIKEGKRSGASPQGCIRTGAYGPGEKSYIPCLNEIVDWLIQKYMLQTAIHQNIQ